MRIRPAFARALRKARKAKGLTQEDFVVVSSRTYLSALERSLKSPTLDKVHELAKAMDVHFLSLMLLTCLESWDITEMEYLLSMARKEVEDISLRQNDIRRR